ncbi:helix-turn-helix domain-containing protein [Leptolyngbya sp. AN03gr2]|uniref:helix-turn-helix domain-containing protein n=1 Tax=unclassified Leptolyngbya TaxID=2650499 RepID=UPI003D31E618
MGKAGKALNFVLNHYGISQNRLAVTMGTNRSTVHQWVNGISDPLAEAVVQVFSALKNLDQSAAEKFIALYLYSEEESDQETVCISLPNDLGSFVRTKKDYSTWIQNAIHSAALLEGWVSSETLSE